MKLSELFTICNSLNYDTAGKDVQYKFVEDKTTLYIYFQYSSSTIDGIRNFMFRRKPYKDMKTPYYVHRGFCEAGKEVEDIVIKKIIEIDNNKAFKGKHIVVAGYSHGAALATFCHECVGFNRPDLREKGLEGYAFEAPRIMAQGFFPKELKQRGKTLTLVRNNTDLVTHVPPILLGYRNVNKIKHIGKWKKYGPIKSHYAKNTYDSLVEEETC